VPWMWELCRSLSFWGSKSEALYLYPGLSGACGSAEVSSSAAQELYGAL